MRMVTRAGGFINAVEALIGVNGRTNWKPTTPGDGSWPNTESSTSECRAGREDRDLENRRRPFTSHFFAPTKSSHPRP